VLEPISFDTDEEISPAALVASLLVAGMPSSLCPHHLGPMWSCPRFVGHLGYGTLLLVGTNAVIASDSGSIQPKPDH
jgi:hypothetical protein